jgi:hypothetical protein
LGIEAELLILGWGLLGAIVVLAIASRPQKSRLGQSLVGKAKGHTQPEEKFFRRWKIAEVLGLWAAAAVGVGAVVRSDDNAKEQDGIMQGQLDEMREQRDFSIAQTRARFRREPIAFQPIDANGLPVTAGGQIMGWAFNPRWFNVGSTAARNFSSWSSFAPAPLTIKDGRRDWQCPATPKVDFPRSGSIVEKDGTIIEQVIRVPEKILERTYGPNPDLAVYIAGRIQYNDIFPDTPLHYFEWCVVATPADLKTGNFSFNRLYEREDDETDKMP